MLTKIQQGRQSRSRVGQSFAIELNYRILQFIERKPKASRKGKDLNIGECLIY